MKLSALLTTLESEFPDLNFPTPGIGDPIISSITSDSRQVGQGTLFVAIRGETRDGHDFISDVLGLGATFILTEKTVPEIDSKKNLIVPDTRKALGLLASSFYGNPSRGLLTVGVTGTSGKTTTTFLIESILKAAGHRVGLIGTVSFRLDGKELPSTHTTPGPVELQRLLREMKDEGCTALVMEVSSHALKQHRSIGVAFDGMVFTNLTQEHLDYHSDMEDYYQSKKLLFTEQARRSKKWGKSPVFAIHAGDDYGKRLCTELTESPTLVPHETSIDAHGIRGVFSGISIESELLARFNAENISCAVAITKKLRITPSSIAEGIKKLLAVPGRLERVPDLKSGRIILVDYAHKPDALEKVLQTLRSMKGENKLFSVFGCGGDRDKSKRAVMGEIACRLSDRVIVTSDNPRTEDPLSIIDEILSGMTGFMNYESEPDRKLAILKAVQQSAPGDFVLIAGKGHETYQIIGTKKAEFDDREVARQALN